MGLKEASLLGNGWAKFPSGLIVQWGQINAISSETKSTTQFTISFPNLCLNVSITTATTDNLTPANTPDMMFQLTKLTNLNFTVFANRFASSALSGSIAGQYIAIGY